MPGDSVRHSGVLGLADQLNNGGAHGFSEVLYAFISCGGNNGSAFAGMNCNIPWINGMFGFLLVFIVLLIGALSFFPALALGPVAEFFQMIA